MYGRDTVVRVNRTMRGEMIGSDMQGTMECLAVLDSDIASLRAGDHRTSRFLSSLVHHMYSAGASCVAVASDTAGDIWVSTDAAIVTDRASLAVLCARADWNGLDAAFLVSDSPHIIALPSEGGDGSGVEHLAFRFDLDANGLWGYRLPEWSESPRSHPAPPLWPAIATVAEITPPRGGFRPSHLSGCRAHQSLTMSGALAHPQRRWHKCQRVHRQATRA